MLPTPQPDPVVTHVSRAEATGEKFIMRRPGLEDSITGWLGLKSALEKCGAQVSVIEHPYEDETVPGHFVRDAGLYIPGDEKNPAGDFLAFVAKQRGDDYQENRELLLQNDLLRGVPVHRFEGRLDGGDLIYDPAHRVIFYGSPEAGRDRMLWQLRLRRQHDETSALKGLEEWAAQRHIRVERLTSLQAYNRDFYHLDGCLGMLPCGRAILCKDVLDPASVARLESILGRDNILAISVEDAQKGAANFITVGNRVITPFASLATQRQLAQWGYEVIDPPSMGLQPGDWQLDKHMGCVRCATMKVSRDSDFPARGRIKED